MTDRRLGDVPGIDDIVPLAQTLAYEDVSVLEVNGIGEIVAGEVGLGDLATPYYSDPFALRPDAGPDQGSGPGNQQVSGGSPAPSGGVPSQYAGTPSSGGVGSVSTGGTVTPSAPVEGFDEEQLANAAAIAEVGRELGASERDIQIALMAAIVESNIRNLDYGDRDSIGMFQQRDAWGSREARLDPRQSARMFFLGGNAGQEGLLDIKDRDSRPMGEVAQDVQVSAYPERYAEHEEAAGRILSSLGQSAGETFTGSVKGEDPYDLTEIQGKTVNYLTAAALDAAQKEFGGEFSLMQGSYNEGGVAASGGTHDGGGVIDLSVPNGDWAGAMTALRKIGFAAWVRNVPGYGQAGSGAHIHAALIGDKTLSPQAQTQIQSYLNNDDGLVGSRPDDGPREFVNNRFTWGDALEAAESVDADFGADEGVFMGGQVADTARTYLGVPFKWGGEAFNGIDAAGLVRKVYEAQGLDLPRNMVEFISGAESIEVEKAKPGDLISWSQGNFGILASDGYVIEANRPGAVVQLSTLDGLPDAFAVPYRTLAESPRTGTAYRPPAVTQSAYSAPYSVAPSSAPTAPGLSHGGDVAPKGGMNSGGSKPKKPEPWETKKNPPKDLF